MSTSPPRRALVLVDVQNEYVDGPLRIGHPHPDDALARIGDAIDAAHAHGIPVVCVQHTSPAEAPVFAAGSERWMLHPEVARRARPEWHRVEKQYASVLAHTDLADWLSDQGVDTITLVGFMTNNCDLATAADAESHGLAVEVLSDATGAIHLANAAGARTAEQVHTTLMVLLQSNWAAVAPADAWIAALAAGEPLPGDNLLASAAEGARGAEQEAPSVGALAINVDVPETLRWRDTRRDEEFELQTITVRMLPDGHLAAKAYGRPVAGGRGGYTSFRVPDRPELHEIIVRAATAAGARWGAHRGL